jgi:pimeloyl-ACP methyl ester carboxylesterase
VGHSLGSFAASIEASTYRDVQGVILSGFAHSLGPGVATIESSTYPAQLDPKFASRKLPLGYLTTRPGTRAADFYHAANADPDVIALDEQLKQTFTDGQVADIGTSETASKGIVVPTLVAVGAFDSLYCAQLPCSSKGSLSGEASYYSAKACVEIRVVPDSGHDLNLQLNAPDWFNTAIEWANDHVGAEPGVPQRGCERPAALVSLHAGSGHD